MAATLVNNLCHCGKKLHYRNQTTERMMQKLVDSMGEFVEIQCGTRRWKVQRHYIALHGIKAEELPKLGFEEINAI